MSFCCLSVSPGVVEVAARANVDSRCRGRPGNCSESKALLRMSDTMLLVPAGGSREVTGGDRSASKDGARRSWLFSPGLRFPDSSPPILEWCGLAGWRWRRFACGRIIRVFVCSPGLGGRGNDEV